MTDKGYGFHIDPAEKLPPRTRRRSAKKAYPEIAAFRALAPGERLFVWNDQYTQRDIEAFWAPKFRAVCDLKIETSTTQFSYDPPGVWFWRKPPKKRK